MTHPKSILRKQMLQYRRLLPEAEWNNRNEQVIYLAHKLIKKLQVVNIHVFLPIAKNREVNLWPMVHQLHLSHQIWVSATDFAEKTMSHFRYSTEMEFVEDAFGIPTPVNATPDSLKQLELVFIPLLAADQEGNRIGYGKGYYDRLLAEMPKSVYKVGLSLNPLFDHFTFSEPHDIALDYCVTPHKTIICND